MSRPVRCPYCVEGREFKLMEPRDPTNGWYTCEGCGHLAMPLQSDFRCHCAKCAGLTGTGSKTI
jgi:hypothetical protein